MRFLASLRSKLRRTARLFPDHYDATRLRGVWTIREFDDAYVAPLSGFAGADDYYKRASALPWIGRITLPTLIIHAKDDPFIPFGPFSGPEIASNPNVALLAPDHGGHVGFIAAGAEGDDRNDRLWGERMVVDFVKLMSRTADAA